jgi:hypothetical protein
LNQLATASAPSVAEFAADQESSVCWMKWAVMEDDTTEFLFEQSERLRETPNHALERTAMSAGGVLVAIGCRWRAHVSRSAFR